MRSIFETTDQPDGGDNAGGTSETDVLVLGGGSTGEAFAAALRRKDEDVRITLVEQDLVGGACSYFACMPSKTLLRAGEALAAARRAPGAAEAANGAIDATQVFAWRDRVTGSLDDVGQEEWLAGLGVDLVRGSGRIVAPGRAAVGKRELRYRKLVVATGSSAVVPTIPGLADTPYWTSRDATQARHVPSSLAVLGGGVVGCELAQAFARLGSRVTLVHRGERLLPRIDPDAGHLLANVFEEEGIDVRLAASTERIERHGDGVRLSLAGGQRIEAERLLVATGRRPNTTGFGLERLGLVIGERGVAVDERLQAGEDTWAIGDVNGIALFTHAGKYQARVAAENVAGGDRRADQRAMPAVVFTDPQVASVGATQKEAATSTWKLTSVARTSTYERPKRAGFVKLFADPESAVLRGAVAVGPEAGEWLGQLTLAVRASTPVQVLVDTIQPYPTFSEAIFFAARELAAHVGAPVHQADPVAAGAAA